MGRDARRPGRESAVAARAPSLRHAQVLSVLCLVAFLEWKVVLPQFLGPLGILLLAAAMWISFGSMVPIYPTYRYSVPSGVLLLVLLAGTFSCWNDNHQVRELRAGPDEPPAAGWRQSFAAHLADWRQARRLEEATERD